MRQIVNGLSLSRPEATAAQREVMHGSLLRVLLHAHSFDVDVSDLLSSVLIEMAGELGGPQEVIVHRNGSWEADHVFRLAGGVERDDLRWGSLARDIAG